ncbi:type II secretion system minor pseudopilin GspJ [Sphingomicrobium astaxanthinifaciens]|uniref:type II secretion system minor pseudopilin GspJ n=1 Tax=Sphingomicrobium astaxanthinifaciens TaxID=1227949 RepID=UPI001FCC8FD0|nr:type II secretion system minor pseudopilin GspJ [Sphingomicrobium astaxanthinifaciens]MCJ7421076.1 type II secretion system minor pseudopilin GspJ [Sphingomicrobium astaxanthinifaciens]
MTRRDGFTLVEMLVGLTIFALVASAGVGLLRASADTQGAVDTALAEQARVERIALLLEADLGQAVLRPTRRPDGTSRPPFSGSPRAMQFVRGGVVALGAEPSSDLRRTGWVAEDNALKRLTFAALDGGEARLPEAVLLDPLGQLSFAYRDAAGGWVDAWPDGSGAPLPRAVRLTLSAPRLPATEFVVALPAVAPASENRGAGR